MSRIEWDKVGERFYETGVSHGVLYLPNAQGIYDQGYGWNGLTGVNESPSGAESNKQYADNIPYLNLVSAEEFSGTIEAFTSPVEFDQCDGSAAPAPGISVGQQTRRTFGFSYRTLVGNDLDGQDHAYKIHVVYGALASPSERSYATVNESPEAVALSWEFSTTPVPISPSIVIEGRELRPTSTLTFDTRNFSADKIKELEDILYGTASTNPRLPSPYELITMMTSVVEEVTPEAPEFNDVNNEITIPSVTGVIYSIGGSVVTDTVTITGPTLVTASPATGYKFPDVVQTQWFFTTD